MNDLLIWTVLFFLCTGIVFVSVFDFMSFVRVFDFFTSIHFWYSHIVFLHSCHRIALKRFVLIGSSVMQSMCMCMWHGNKNKSMTNFVNNSTSALLCNPNHLPKVFINAYLFVCWNLYLSLSASIVAKNFFVFFVPLTSLSKLIWYSKNFSGFYFNQVCWTMNYIVWLICFYAFVTTNREGVSV